MLAALDDLAVLVDQFRRQNDDAPVGLALAGAHRADAELDVQYVVHLDRQQEVPGPAERHAGYEAIVALRLEAVRNGQAEQAMRDDAAEVARVRVILIDVHGRVIAREIGIGENALLRDRVSRADAFVAFLRIVPVFSMMRPMLTPPRAD